jgi:hypothetical protein
MIGWNRGDDARQLLTEVEDWCGRTSTPEGTVGHALFLHPGFVGLLRKRLTLSVEKEIAVREFIYWNHPDGYRGPLPLTGCPRCGVRADVGCRHTAGASE